MTFTRVIALAWLLLAASGVLAQDPGRIYSYKNDIQPILEKNCVICHACYDAPCQLKMESPEGLDRGASKAPVYAPGLKTRETTRLFADANTTEEWRRKGFFSVIEGGPSSLLGRMLELGKMQVAAKANQPLPPEIKLGLAHTNECPSRTEFDAYKHRHMHEGMPFGMAPLAPEDYATLSGWLAQGAPIDGMNEPSRGPAAGTIAQIEAFLNRPAAKDQLVARYIYEHLFVAHLYLDRAASTGFFELVRSTTPPGQPIQVVPTRRPTDDPGDEVYYRLRPLRGSIVEKTHITYYFGPDKLAHVQGLFASEKFTVDELPPYQRNGATNPFHMFAAIPARLRYQFMLDDSLYFVQCFIRGPVCLGQVATDVIEDHFATFFQTPESDRFCMDPAYAATQLEDVDLDGRDGFAVDVMPRWMRAEINYSKRRLEQYSTQGTSFAEIWRGNADAVLTIFRNFDSATVIRGLKGRSPKTLWVMDYPIFERIYYLLVANFDVFGSATHQVTTRLYFDLLRAESEVNFLRWLPKTSRKPTLAGWYKGTTFSLKTRLVYPDPDTQSETEVTLGGGDPKEAFIALVRREMGGIAGPAGDLSGMCSPAQDARFASADSARAEAALAPLAEGVGSERPWLKNLPETTFVRVEVDGGAGDLAFTLNRAKWHSNVASMLREGARLDPDQDYVTLLRGPVGCYPNFIFHVKLADLDRFVQNLTGASDAGMFAAVVDSWGVRRTHPGFWNDFRFFRDYHAQRDPVEAGVFDANRYENF